MKDPRLHALVADAVEVAHTNGASTITTLELLDHLNARFGTAFVADLQWQGLTVYDEWGIAEHRTTTPAAIVMSRVTSLQHAVGSADDLTVDGLATLVERARHKPTEPIWRFAVACGVAAIALALIFGAERPTTPVFVGVAAAVGGVLRRWVAPAGQVVQAFVGALVGGLVGAWSVHLGLTSDARLVAACPAMVIVPGPHFLNGCLDLARARYTLGIARLTHALVVTLGISAGVVAGLALGGASLPLTATSPEVALWLDVLAAGVAAACYPIFFSMPHRTIGAAVVVGMLAHAARWVTIYTLGGGAALGSLVACVVAGTLLTLVSSRYRIPFAGAGFAAVVALVPGVFGFRTVAGLLDIATGATDATTVGATLQDAATFGLIMLAMAVGLSASHLGVRAVLSRLGRAPATRGA